MNDVLYVHGTIDNDYVVNVLKSLKDPKGNIIWDQMKLKVGGLLKGFISE